jgi:hypothetical protein
LKPEQYKELMAAMTRVSQAVDDRTRLTPQPAVLTTV